MRYLPALFYVYIHERQGCKISKEQAAQPLSSKERTELQMEDSVIIELYWQRLEAAISESRTKYGRYCTVIADNILHCPEDTEECLDDTWLKAWEAMPPQKPDRLSVFLGKITRNLAIDRYRKNRAGKYGKGQIALCLDELAECVGTDETIADDLALKKALDGFLQELEGEAKDIFMLRYWHMFSVKEIANRLGKSDGAVKMSLQRTRSKLRSYLEQEGFDI